MRGERGEGNGYVFFLFFFFQIRLTRGKRVVNLISKYLSK